MEHPIFSVSTKLSGYYEQNYLLIDIKPVTNGNATVHDCDILIVSISQLIFALNDRAFLQNPESWDFHRGLLVIHPF